MKEKEDYWELLLEDYIAQKPDFIVAIVQASTPLHALACYVIRPDDKPGPKGELGYHGVRSSFRFDDPVIGLVNSHNCWFFGHVPEEYKDRLKVNARWA